MKKGMTLTSVVIYVIVMLVVVGVVGTITGFFYSSAQNLDESASSLGEFNKFNAFFLEEVKLAGNAIDSISTNQISFTSGTTFTFEENGVYKDKVKICSNVKACEFRSYTQEEKTVVQVYIEIGEDVAKTIEYVMQYDVIGQVGQYEENYTENYEDEYIKTGLVLHYDGINNTGNGNSSTTTKWRDLSGNGNDGTLNGATWGANYLSFDGTDDWVSIGEMNYENVTLEAIVEFNEEALSDDRCIIANYESGGYALYLEQDSNRNAFTVNIGGTYYAAKSSGSMEKGKVYKVTATYDGTTIKLWENEVIFQKQISGTIKYPESSTIMVLGANPKGNLPTARYLAGKIYAVRIYNRALSENEVAQNYEVDKLRYGL